MYPVLERIFRRKLAYQECFADKAGNLTKHGQIVMSDLAKFCRAFTSTATVVDGTIDPIAMALAEGRREVFNRIQQYLHLDDEVLFKLKEQTNE